MPKYSTALDKLLFTIDRRKLPKDQASSGRIISLYRIYYIMKGEVDYFIKDKCYRGREGDLVFVNTNTLSRNIYNSASERILLKIDPAVMENLCSDIGNDDLIELFRNFNAVFHLRPKSKTRIEGILLNILDEFAADNIGDELMVKNLLTEFLIMLTREINSHIKEGTVNSEIVMTKAGDIVAYINANYMQELSLRHLSDKFFISPYYMIKVFKKYTGFTVTEYINHIRIQEAARLLGHREAKVSYVAEVTGFNNTTNFSRVFKKIMHISPAKYRVSLTRTRGKKGL